MQTMLQLLPVRDRLGISAALVVLFSHALAFAQFQDMSTDEMIELARPAVGHAYHWGHGNWTRDGSQIGTCTPNSSGGGCPACSFAGSFGTDCSGFVAKVWQVPGPSAVEDDNHPYATGGFAAGTSMWADVDDPSSVMRGDAFVKGGSHIVFVDQRFSDTSYMVYHASGCSVGVAHQPWDLKSGFKPIRREQVTIDASDCNEHGSFGADGSCHCEANFSGHECERCRPGFENYPQCSAASECADQKGTLRCGDTVAVTVSGGLNQAVDYGCGIGGLNAEEMVYNFRPPGVGVAKFTLSSSDDVSMMLMRMECAPSGCIKTSKSEMEINFGGNDEFFLALDAPSAGSAQATLSVSCETPRGAWIGDPCSTDSDCPDDVKLGTSTPVNGYCYHGPAGSFCSMDCYAFNGSQRCGEIPNSAGTVCIAVPGESNTGMCVALAEDLNQHCATVPGTVPQTEKKFKASTQFEVCYPVEDPTLCVADFKGMVVNAADGSAIEGARVTYQGLSSSEFVDTDALGRFSSGDAMCASHLLKVEATGFAQATVGAELGARGMDVGLIKLQSMDAGQCIPLTAAISGRVVDGITSAGIEGASVELRRGNGVSSGPAEATEISDADGLFSFGGLVGGDYTINAEASGYATGGREIVTICEDSQEEANVFLTPETSGLDNKLRFVLTWNHPEDLDLHLLTPSGEDVFYWEGCRGSAETSPYAVLDVDHYDQDGPETITVMNFMPGRYELFVHNFAAQNWQEPELEGQYDPNPEDLLDSGAEITVYNSEDEVIERFPVPSTGSGYFWNVLSVVGGGETPTITPVQQLTNARKNPFSEYAGLCNPD